MKNYKTKKNDKEDKMINYRLNNINSKKTMSTV